MAQRDSALGPGAAVCRFHDLALLGMLASGYGAVLASGAMDAANAVVAAAALLARLAVVVGALRLKIPGLWVNVATLGYVAFYPLDWRYISKDFLAATVHLVFFVAVIKLLTAETSRDHLLLKIIALLEVLAAALLSTDLAFLPFLALFLICSIAALASGEVRLSAGKARMVPSASRNIGPRLAVMTGVSSAVMLALTAGLFFILPRTARAALSWITPSMSRVSGFGNEVVLGQSGPIRRSSEVVMHYQFKGGVRPIGLRWRGTALAEFDGLRWFNTQQPGRVMMPGADGWLKLAGDDQLRRTGPRLNYEVVLHRTNSDWIFVAGMPEYLRLRPTQVLMTAAGGLRAPFAQHDGLRYAVVAWPGDPSPPAFTSQDRIFHLRLPAPDTRVLRLANDITATARTDMERAQAIERWLRSNLRYSLDPWEKVEDDPLSYFLFVRRKGHCEYFASAMAVMLRAVWVPSRVATGFIGGTYNPLVEWQAVRASDAHSWVEAWIPGTGWVTFDPTPAAEEGQSSLSRITMWMDAAELFWQEWVIGYDLDRQLTLALSVNEGRRRLSLDWAARLWERMTRIPKGVNVSQRHDLLAWLLGLAGTAAALPFAVRQARHLARRRRADRGELSGHDATIFYGQMLDSLARRGLVKLAGQTPEEFARSIPETSVGPAVSEFTRAYYDARYGALASGATRLGPLLDKIRSLP
jgi:hypothetical protein